MRADSQRTSIPEPFIALHTTRLEALFDPTTGFLRRVRSGGAEVLLAIYGAVRDRNWNTILPVISEVSLRSAPDEFELGFTAECIEGEAHFRWKGMIRGRGDELEFSFDGRACSEFYKNRIGICVLHSSSQCAGKPCRILRTDETLEESAFPLAIAPHQPFKQVKGIIWTPVPGIGAELGFEGDIFETEDQRNWTDASFKTYSTPLEIPFPAKVAEGAEVRQRVLLKVEPPAVGNIKSRPEVITLRYADTAPRTMPPIGLCLPSHSSALSIEAAQLLRELQPAHLRVDLFPAQTGWLRDWERAIAEARAVGTGLHCALFLRDEAGLEAFAEKARETLVPIRLCLLFDQDGNAAPDRWLAAARRLLGERVPIVTGTNANFADLNRNRPTAGASACFSINPQCHVFDDMSLMENLEAQNDTIRTAREFGCDPVVVSPITLKARIKGSSTEARDQPPADPRQKTLFGAAWTLGSLARLAPEPGVDSLTYYETTGPLGVIGQRSSASVYPGYHVFADLAGFPEVVAMESSESSAIAGLALTKPGGGRRILLANLTPESRAISLLIRSAGASVRILDQTTLKQATTAPEAFRVLPGKQMDIIEGKLLITLEAYALARIDS